MAKATSSSHQADTKEHRFATKLIREDPSTPRSAGTVLPVPKEIVAAIPKRPDGTKRLYTSIESLPTYQAKIQGNGRGGHYVAVNRQRESYLTERYGVDATLKVIVTPDLSKYGLPVPVEWELLLAEDAEAATYFEMQVPQLQRRILYGIASPRTEATRLHRAVVTAEYLKEVRGEVDLKELTRAWSSRHRLD